MRNIISHLVITLDGVVKLDAVIDTIVQLRDTDEVEADFFGKVAEEDAMLMGRKTYEEWADYWPTSTLEPFASHINGVPKYVVSTTSARDDWGEHGKVTLLNGDLATEIAALKQQPGKQIGVHGSPTLVESLLHADLLDTLRLEIYPVIAGGGTRLVSGGRGPKQHRLVDSKTTSSGVVIVTYGR